MGEINPTQMDKTAPVGQQSSPSKTRDRNFFLPKEIPKQKKKGPNKKKQEKYNEMRTGLCTPTTDKLRGTFIIKNSGESFDTYYNQMRRRKGEGAKGKARDAAVAKAKKTMKPTFRPNARDGHSAIMQGNQLFIFGGDRHHMAYNDLFTISL